MSDISAMMEDDEQGLHLPTQEQLNNISKLVQHQLHLENIVAEKEAQLKEAKEELRKVKEEDLPTALQEAGTEEFKTTDGFKVKVKTGYAGSISKANERLAYQWLGEHGYGGIVKTKLDLSFGKNEEDKAKEAELVLHNAGFQYGRKRSVHASTLKSFINEAMEKQSLGELEVPEKLFNVYRWKKAEIKQT